MAYTEEHWLSCCGSSKFAKEMGKIGPFANVEEAVEMSRQIWWNKVDIPGWLEAFAAHPRIGDVKALGSRSTANPEWCEGEQSAALRSADDRAMKDLAMWNRLYEAKFGHVFLVCATGKSSSEILELLKVRMNNSPLSELEVAATEQQKITELRLSKLMSGNGTFSEPQAAPPPPTTSQRQAQEQLVPPRLSSQQPAEPEPEWAESVPPPLVTSEQAEEPSQPSPSASTRGRFRTGNTVADARLNKIQDHVQAPGSPITTHVLDVSLGRPAAGIDVSLERLNQIGHWDIVGKSSTNDDGRARTLMEASAPVEAGQYKITFNTGKYLSATQTTHKDAAPFYPFVSVVFEILPSQTSQHFHVPLLLSPFSFTTYRGS